MFTYNMSFEWSSLMMVALFFNWCVSVSGEKISLYIYRIWTWYSKGFMMCTFASEGGGFFKSYDEREYWNCLMLFLFGQIALLSKDNNHIVSVEKKQGCTDMLSQINAKVFVL